MVIFQSNDDQLTGNLVLLTLKLGAKTTGYHMFGSIR